MTLNTDRPVLLLGGKENSLSIARHLGSRGITVRASGNASCWGQYSRYCAESFRVPRGVPQQQYWRDLLLGGNSRLDGHIVLALSDDALEFIATNRALLVQRYMLDQSDPDLQQAFLDKRRTLELAEAAGIDAPLHWELQHGADLEAICKTLRFPVAVKPIQSHKFSAVFGRKLFVIDNDPAEFRDKVELAWQSGIDVFAVEMIPGPDSQLSSYYTYRTGEGRNLFHFTKSIVRRWPVNRGNACYHRTGWLPETAEAGRRFFDAVGLKGFGNIEFKRDARDGKLKIIEVNARFTAAQELMLRAGAPVDLLVYCHLTGQPLPHVETVSRELYYWYPLRDFLSFLELHKRGELTLMGWLKSVTHGSHVYPLASWADPLPAAGAALAILGRLIV